MIEIQNYCSNRIAQTNIIHFLYCVTSSSNKYVKYAAVLSQTVLDCKPLLALHYTKDQYTVLRIEVHTINEVEL